ncbi:hypothetical protein DYB28_001172 [Aphanomyces astaci]|uniref:Uncharacterized protein n=1 Tax=Aphanomyces astaci TaxID=112090 RepID=A0A9X8DV39_APHAT|nr:hypothetical protein DYB28_001172 [Aphanomyces astaci]
MAENMTRAAEAHELHRQGVFNEALTYLRDGLARELEEARAQVTNEANEAFHVEVKKNENEWTSRMQDLQERLTSEWESQKALILREKDSQQLDSFGPNVEIALSSKSSKEGLERSKLLSVTKSTEPRDLKPLAEAGNSLRVSEQCTREAVEQLDQREPNSNWPCRNNERADSTLSGQQRIDLSEGISHEGCLIHAKDPAEGLEGTLPMIPTALEDTIKVAMEGFLDDTEDHHLDLREEGVTMEVEGDRLETLTLLNPPRTRLGDLWLGRQ